MVCVLRPCLDMVSESALHFVAQVPGNNVGGVVGVKAMSMPSQMVVLVGGFNPTVITTAIKIPHEFQVLCPKKRACRGEGDVKWSRRGRAVLMRPPGR